MVAYEIISLTERPEYQGRAAAWFHEKWQVPSAAYLESMQAGAVEKALVPKWYIAVAGEQIIAGLGVIDNDFHQRKDLAPNVCALYVEEAYRRQGLGGVLLNHVCKEMKKRGISTLYLVTDHISYYEHYGWNFLCMVKETDSDSFIRMYVHHQS